MWFTLLLLTLTAGAPALATDAPAGRTAHDPAVADGIKAYKSQHFVEASIAMADALDAQATQPEALYYLARSLDALGLPNAAADHDEAILNQGTSGPYFKYALPKFAAGVAESGDWYPLAKIAAKLPESAWPTSSRSRMAYALALRLAEKGDRAGALAALGLVSDESDEFPLSRLLEGQLFEAQGKGKAALKSYSLLARPTAPDRQADLKAMLKEQTGYVESGSAASAERNQTARDRGALALARIGMALGQPEDGRAKLAGVGKRSPVWRRAQLLLVEMEVQAGAPKAALRRLGLLQAPTTKAGPLADYLPEAPLLEAEAHLSACDTKRATKALDRGAAERSTLAAWLDAAPSSESGKRPEVALTLRIDGPPPAAVAARLQQDPEYAALAWRLKSLEVERARARAFNPAWRKAVGPRVAAALDAAQIGVERRLHARSLVVLDLLGADLASAEAATQALRTRSEAACAAR